jgi:Cysteine-rich secretory protein family
MKNRGSWRGALVVVFAIGAGWIGYMGWPLYGLITLSAEQSNSPNRPKAPAVVQDPNCPGNDNHALMCRLVNEYRAKYGLKPVQLDEAVTREAQYWSDQLNRQNDCWFLYHDTTITPACERDFQAVDFVKTQRAAAQPAAAPYLFCANGSIPQVIAKIC